MTTRAPSVPIKKLFWKRLSHSNRIILISTERNGIWNTISFSWNASSICSNGRYCHPILFVFASSPFHMCPIITFLFLFSRRVQHFHINLSQILLFIAALLNELDWMVTPQPLKSKTAVRGTKDTFSGPKKGSMRFFIGGTKFMWFWLGDHQWF